MDNPKPQTWNMFSAVYTPWNISVSCAHSLSRVPMGTAGPAISASCATMPGKPSRYSPSSAPPSTLWARNVSTSPW